MQKIIFIMGIPNAGKSTYIKNNFNLEEYKVLDVLDYQRQYNFPSYEQIMQSYLDLLEEIKINLDNGVQNIIVEHTLLKACRREMYLDLLKKYDVEKNIICIMVEKEKYTNFCYDENMQVLEIPTLEEGWDKVNTIWR